ncbi:hypothetical protein [Stenotrophomonas sp. GbtcB23]|nr:hypothetical protein [Stenotrophomonas sp. GbtcB23]
MLASKGAYPGFPETYRNELRNPTVELPFDTGQVLKGVDAVLVTHTEGWQGIVTNTARSSLTD